MINEEMPQPRNDNFRQKFDFNPAPQILDDGLDDQKERSPPRYLGDYDNVNSSIQNYNPTAYR